MFLVGLTGGIATGKSTVSSAFREYGVAVLDADVIARKVVEPGRPAWKKIKKEFGDEVFLPNGTLNRQRLGEIIFANQEKRRILNKITHPQVYKEMFLQCLALFLKGHRYAVLDLPLLYESGYMVPFVNKIVVVKCRPEQQLQRLMDRNLFTAQEALSRINAQMSLEEKCRRADFVIDNSRSVEDTETQVRRTVEDLSQSWAHWKLRFALLACLALLAAVIYFLVNILF